MKRVQNSCCVIILLKILLERKKNHVDGNFSQVMRKISNERENLNRLLPVLLRTIFQIFNTISSGEKMGGRRGEGKLNTYITICNIHTIQALREEGAKVC